MKYYVHGVSDSRWLGEDFFELKGETITIDLQCLNNEWSTYLINDPNDCELLDKIALQFFTECNRYVDSSIALVLFSPTFLAKHNLKEPEDGDYTVKMPLDLHHYNIRSNENVLKVRCIINVGQDLFKAFNSEEDDLLLPIRFYSPIKIASIIKNNKDSFRTLLSGNQEKIGKMKTLFDSINDSELSLFLGALLKKK